MARRLWPVLVLLFALAAPAAAQTPAINNVIPPIAATEGGVRITIFGSSFGAAGGSVRIQDREVAIAPGADWGPTRVLVTLPPGDPGFAPVEVLPASGPGSDPFLGFSYQAPILFSITPDTGPSMGGVLITLTGANFGTADAVGSVQFGGTPALMNHGSHTEATVVVPALLPGQTFPVQLVINGLIAAGPTYSTVSPRIDDFQPRTAAAVGGSLITIVGDNFGEVVHPAPVVKFGGIVATGASRTSQQEIVCQVPQGAGADIPVTVQVGNAQSGESIVLFSYAGPIISGLSPLAGPATGGMRITLEGQNFGPPGTPRALQFFPVGGGNPVPAVLNGPESDGELEADVPDLAPGVYAARLAIAGQMSNVSFYEALLVAPVVNGLSLPSGPTEGGVPITIYGSNFGAAEGIARIGAWPCPIDDWSDTEIVCRTPEGWSGTFGVVVERSSDGASGGGAVYLYDPAFIIQAFPTPMASDGGTLLTIVGQNFGRAEAPREVTIDGQIVIETQWLGHGQIVVLTPPGTANTSVPLCVGIVGKPGDCVSVEYGSAVGVDPPRLPTAFGLRLAGANPAREATAFAVDLPRDARYALDVFDSAGRLVRRFVGEGAAGTQVVRWDGAATGGARVPPGLYWARLEVAGERFVRKVMRL